MAGPKDKRKKTKRTQRYDKDGNKIRTSESPSEKFYTKTYNPSGKKSGEEEYSFKDKTHKKDSWSAKSKTIDTKPNKQIQTIIYDDGTKQTIKGSTQKGNYESEYSHIFPKKSGAGYSGD